MSQPLIAVVEDNPDNRLLIDAMLSGSFRTVEYEDGMSAVSGLAGDQPDLVLLDISLPEMSGVEVLAQLREDPGLERVPVIAVTAHAMNGDRERYLQLGFDEYVSKPIIDMDEFIATIDRCLAAAGNRS